MNDPTFLAKIGEKMGDVAPPAAAAAPDEPEEIEINNILDAVRWVLGVPVPLLCLCLCCAVPLFGWQLGWHAGGQHGL